MGKSPKPLRMLIHPSLEGWDEFQEYRNQGHTVDVMTNADEYDVILGPTSWRMEHSLKKFVKLAVAEARKLRYPK